MRSSHTLLLSLTHQGLGPVVPAVYPHPPVAAVGVAVGVGVVRQGAAQELVHRASWVIITSDHVLYNVLTTWTVLVAPAPAPAAGPHRHLVTVTLELRVPVRGCDPPGEGRVQQ